MGYFHTNTARDQNVLDEIASDGCAHVGPRMTRIGLDKEEHTLALIHAGRSRLLAKYDLPYKLSIQCQCHAILSDVALGHQKLQVLIESRKQPISMQITSLGTVGSGRYPRYALQISSLIFPSTFLPHDTHTS